MPFRTIASEELAKMFSAMSHPARIQIIEELRVNPCDVSSLETSLGISQSSVSQHLSILKSNHIVESKREGRNVFYSLTRPWTAHWLREGLKMIDADTHSAQIAEAAEKASELWSTQSVKA